MIALISSSLSLPRQAAQLARFMLLGVIIALLRLRGLLRPHRAVFRRLHVLHALVLIRCVLGRWLLPLRDRLRGGLLPLRRGLRRWLHTLPGRLRGGPLGALLRRLVSLYIHLLAASHNILPRFCQVAYIVGCFSILYNGTISTIYAMQEAKAPGIRPGALLMPWHPPGIQ